jgi:chromosome partitioning protein
MQKGGVGKTTTICNVAGAASARALSTLVVDFDPQGNTTSTLAAEAVARNQLTIADAVHPEEDERVPLADVMVPTIWEHVRLAPAVTNSLTKVERLINAADHDREYRLIEALEPELANVDLVLVDNAPSLGQLMRNALNASDYAFAVVQADQWSCDGLGELRETVKRVQRRNRGLTLSGALISMWRNTADEKFWLREIIENFDEAEVWEHDKIPQWTAIKTTLNAGIRLDQSRESRLRVLGHTYRRLLARWVPDPEVTI